MAPSVCPKIHFPSFPRFCLLYLGTKILIYSFFKGLAILIGAVSLDSHYIILIEALTAFPSLLKGPTSGAGICRILANPSQGNLAVAVLARNPENLNAVAKGLRSSTPNPVEAFPTDTSPEKLSKAFSDIRSHSSFKDLKLKVAVFHVKHASKVTWLRPMFVLASPECKNRNLFLRKRIPSSRNPLTRMLEVRWPFRKR